MNESADRTSPTRIVAVGDVLLGDSAIAVGYGFSSRYPEGIGDLRDELASVLGDGDVVFGNLECTLSQKGHRADRWSLSQMRGFPSYAADLRDAGFTVLNVANNHAVQHGFEAFHETVTLLQQAGIAVCGVRGTDGWCSRPVFLPDETAPRVAIVGYCLRPRQYAKDREPPFAEGTAVSIRQDVTRLASLAETIVVSLHWGEEFVEMPSEAEVDLAHSLVDAGAALVLGHHPHVVRPIESYRSGVIAYSLGNFVADMVWDPPLRRGLVLDCVAGGGQVAVERASTIRIGSDYGPKADGDMAVSPTVVPLDGVAYAKAVAETVSRQRRRSYMHALRNIFRFRPTILRQLLLTTLGNKIGPLLPLRMNGRP